MKNLDKSERERRDAQILERRRAGCTVYDLVVEFGLNRRTIQGVLKRWREQGGETIPDGEGA